MRCIVTCYGARTHCLRRHLKKKYVNYLNSLIVLFAIRNDLCAGCWFEYAKEIMSLI